MEFLAERPRRRSHLLPGFGLLYTLTTSLRSGDERWTRTERVMVR
jgi:hypothetical protein